MVALRSVVVAVSLVHFVECTAPPLLPDEELGACQAPNSEEEFVEPMSLLQTVTRFEQKRDAYGHPSWLSSCTSIYLDVGSNVGVQVRKLFEPHLFPFANVLPSFTRHYGSPAARCAPSSQSGLCALGFEPNPQHHEELRALEANYTCLGWHVHFYPFAAGYEEGNVTFDIEDWSPDREGVGAHVDTTDGMFQNPTGLTRPAGAKFHQVTARTIGFADFLKTLPQTATVPFMKLDIEGAEWDVLANLDEQRMLCRSTVQECAMEVHSAGNTGHWQRNRTLSAILEVLSNQTCNDGPMATSYVDDESYQLGRPNVPPGHGSPCNVACNNATV